MAKDKERESTGRKSGGETVAIKAREVREEKRKALSKGKGSGSTIIHKKHRKPSGVDSELTVPGGVQAGLHELVTAKS